MRELELKFEVTTEHRASIMTNSTLSLLSRFYTSDVQITAIGIGCPFQKSEPSVCFAKT
jgi:hypothetical protein